LAVKAYIVDSLEKVDLEKIDLKIDDLKNKNLDKENNVQSESNEAEPLKFVVPACVLGEGCNHCGNCH